MKEPVDFCVVFFGLGALSDLLIPTGFRLLFFRPPSRRLRHLRTPTPTPSSAGPVPLPGPSAWPALSDRWAALLVFSVKVSLDPQGYVHHAAYGCLFFFLVLKN